MNIKQVGKGIILSLLIGTLAAALVGCGGTKDAAKGAASGDKKVITVAHTNYYVPYDYVNDKGERLWFRVLAGSYRTRAEAEAAIKDLESKGFKDSWLMAAYVKEK